ncbi:MAG TPA: hypothetical protein VGR38_04905 [Candidatus Polarisedimenticolia bacterium]|jgi:hypothetical protein|nr:hypothetical protein [Candidatus Polarisedimenticolia bacterium]
MAPKTLDAIMSEYREEREGPRSAGAKELERFQEFLVKHLGLRKLEFPGRKEQLLVGAEALRCFHFSQYLDWYLAEKIGVSHQEREAARATLSRFNEWLLERKAISREVFEENQGSILGVEAGPMEREEIAGGGDDPDDAVTMLPEEKDFYVPGEYSLTLSGEFVITKVQEGILYGRRPVDSKEIGPILVDRTVSGVHKVGDRVHLSLGKAGDHWNVLTLGRRAT